MEKKIKDQQIIFEIIDGLLKREGMTEQRAQEILNISSVMLPMFSLAIKAYTMGKQEGN